MSSTDRSRGTTPGALLIRSALVALALVAVPPGPGSGLSFARPKGACTPVVPCADKRGCPDFVTSKGVLSRLFIDTRTFSSTDCAFIEGSVGGTGDRRLLLFSTYIANLGPGALFLGNPADHPDWFELNTCDGLPDIKDYAGYRLWTPAGYAAWNQLRQADPSACAEDVLAAHPELLPSLVTGLKMGCCFFDVLSMSTPISSLTLLTCPLQEDPQTYTSCAYGGMSVCWADIYEPIFDGQWIDITDVADGTYVLEVEANEKHFITEADYGNNRAAVDLQFKRKKVAFLAYEP